MAAVQPYPSVDTGPERDITSFAGKSLELPWQATSVSLGDPASQPDVLP